MNFLLILNRAIEFGVIIPGMLICLMPVTKWIKTPSKKLYLSLTMLVILFCTVCGFLCVIKNLFPSFFFIPSMMICMVGYFCKVDLEKRKLWYLFLCAIASLSFGGLANEMTEAKLNPDMNWYGYAISGLIVQYVISFFILFIFYLIRHKITWLLENFHSKLVWRIIWIIPALTAFCNRYMQPREYSNTSVGRIFYIYLVIDTALLLFFIIFQIMFFYIAKTSAEKYQAEKTALMYQMQSNQYESLKIYLEQTSRMRHDFKHVMATVGHLLHNKQYEELLKYADSYNQTFSHNNTLYVFCANTSINALLSYYAGIAADYGIQIHFQVQTPDTDHISDLDLSILFGNLLDNAIYACKKVPKGERYINLSTDTDTPGSFYIVMANSCDGRTKELNGRFLSTKEEGSAIGLPSIQAIAGKYHGIARFSANDKEFISNIMLKE